MASNPENTDPKDPPSRDNAELDPEERDFWELDDELEGSGEGPAETGAETEPETEAEGEAVPEDEDLEEDEESAEEENEEAAPRRKKLKLGMGEKAALGILGLVLIVAAIYGLNLVKAWIPTSDPRISVDFPVKGEQVVVAAVETYWRAPDETKDKGVRRAARLIPAAMVTLKSSENCALRFFFEDEVGDMLGDPVTLGASGGKFTGRGSEETEVYGTAGFDNEGFYAAYIAGELDPWFLVVKEGPSLRASGREFKEVLRIPIARTRR